MAIDWAVMRGLGYRRYADMIRGLDLDAIPVNQALYLMGWRRWVLPFVEYYTDEWGVRSRFAGELLPVPVGHPVATPADLEHFRPPRPEKTPLLKAVRYVKRRAPDRAVVLVSRNDFAASWFLCGFDVLLMSFIDNPDFVDRLGRMVNDYYARLFELAIQAGVDVVFLTDDYAYKSGTLMSREHFERFVLPLLERSVRAIHAAGGLCVKHTDGDVSGILDLLVGTGVDGIGPLEPAAGNDLVEIQRRWGDRVAVLGNIDVDLLSRGTSAEVETATERLVRALAPRGGHLLASGNTITSSVQPENLRAMVEAGRRAFTAPERS
jgi:uroporphyrinogen decarboxylase